MEMNIVDYVELRIKQGNKEDQQFVDLNISLDNNQFVVFGFHADHYKFFLNDYINKKYLSYNGNRFYIKQIIVDYALQE